MCVRADDTTRLLILRLLYVHGTLICVTKTLEVGQEGVGQNATCSVVNATFVLPMNINTS